jgi:ComF family protein
VCAQWTRGRLCAACRERFAAPALRCARCALPLASAHAACGACLRQPPPFDATVCAVDYAFPWSRLLGAFKFQGAVDLAPALAALLAEAVQGRSEPRPQLVLPVPLGSRRLAARGYNQAWELARRVARRLGLDARPDVLQRLLETPPQAELSRAQRLANLRAAFAVAPRHRARLAGLHVALVDDVMTTGATVSEAAAALRRAGAARVDAWVVARTPDLPA